MKDENPADGGVFYTADKVIFGIFWLRRAGT
jgi:hypothetical protein